jgi:heme/copper-type cytochrome/quinol oxidase subunit 2
MPSAADKWRSLMGAVVVIVGLVVVAGVFAGTVWKFRDANEIVAIVGSVTGVVGTIVTAFFGIHATAAAGTDAATAAAYADPDKAGELADKLRGVSPVPNQSGAAQGGAPEHGAVRSGPPAAPAAEGGRG